MQRQFVLAVVFLVIAVLVTSATGATAVAGQETVTLTVSVVSEDGVPVGDATIDVAWDGGSSTATTASNGKAFVDVPKGADVRIAAESERFIRNNPKRIENASEHEVTVEVAQKGRLTVRLVDTEGPVENARVRLTKDAEIIANGRTNASGYFVSPTIERGDYVVNTAKNGYYRNSSAIGIDADTAIVVEMRQGSVNVGFTVVDDHFAPPKRVTDAVVSVEGIGSQRTSSGAVTFTLPINSPYRVEVTKAGYTANETRIHVETDPETRTIGIQRVPNLTVAVANERIVVDETVEVTVTNAYGERVPGAAVLLDGNWVAETGSAGTARVTIESPGEHTITAERDGTVSAGVALEGVAVDGSSPTATPTATPSPSASPTEPDDTDATTRTPGFTAVTAVLALLVLALVLVLAITFRKLI